MGARLRIFLTPEQDRTLRELHKAKDVPQRIKDRAEVVRMSARGVYVEEIAEFFCLDQRNSKKYASSLGKGWTWRSMGSRRTRKASKMD
jgi:DNA-binding NarL/FixJ family response regulator